MSEIIIISPASLKKLLSDAISSELEAYQESKSPPVNEVLTNKQAMDYLHVSRSTLQRWRKDGVLPYRKVQEKILYTKSDIDKLLEGAAK